MTNVANKSAKQRVEDESSDLNDRIERLESFIDTARYEALSIHQKNLLRAQVNMMRAYSAILWHRLSIWED